MRDKKLKEEFIDHFNNKYTTSVTFDEIMAEINANEENKRLQECREYYINNNKKILRRTRYCFSGIICLLIVLFAFVIISDLGDYEKGLEDILTKEEMSILFDKDNVINTSYNHIALNGNFDLYIINNYKLINNKKIYTYYYKIFFIKHMDDSLTLKIDSQEYKLTNENSFGKFYTLEKEPNEVKGITFTTIYDGEERTYNYIE